MNIDPTFRERRKINRKRQYDENNDEEIALSAKKSFEVEYFNYIIDHSITSIESTFEQFKEYETIFGFLFDMNNLKALDNDEQRKLCLNLEKYLTFGEHLDIDGLDLFQELTVMRDIFDIKTNTPLDILNYIKKLDSFPNAYIAYRILLTIPVTVASAEKSFSKLKLIKSYLRSTMTQERLSGLSILSIESDMMKHLDYKNLISTFAAEKARKLK